MARISTTSERPAFPWKRRHSRRPTAEAAVRFVKAARREGKETHNRFWISAALTELGFPLAPDDPRIASPWRLIFQPFMISAV